MSYRSIKRVLGETSLERKCRLLFGACLLLLISGAFWGVDRIAGNLVMTNTRNHGHDLIDIIMIKVHSLFSKRATRGRRTIRKTRQARMAAGDHRRLRGDAGLSL